MYNKLNDVEKTIIKLIGKGYKNSEIAKELNKSVATIATYVFHLSKQHNAKNRIDLFNKLKGEI